MAKSHTHRCAHCGKRFTCIGERIDNPDGWPEVLCAAEDGGDRLIKPLCDNCTDAQGELQDARRREA